MSSPPVDVVGSAIGGLVAVDALATAGHSVRWFRPAGPLGGGFQPLDRDGRRLELGMRLIELSYDHPTSLEDGAAEPPLADYRPGPHGHRPYLGTVDRFIRSLAANDLRVVDRPTCWVRGTVGADYVVVGDLSDLGRFVGTPTLRSIAAETARAIEVAGPRGVQGGSEDDPRWDAPLAEIGPAQTGPTFWRALIQPLLDRIVGPCDLPTSRHRKVWMPLFHPATLHDAATGRLSYRPDRPLYTLEGGGVNLMLERLETRVRHRPAVEVIPIGPITTVRGSGRNVVFGDADGTEHSTTRPIVGVDPRALFNGAGVVFDPKRGNANVAWVDTDLRDHERACLPSVEWIVDDRLPSFRVSRSWAEPNPADPHRCTWAVELRHDFDGDAAVEAVRTVRELGLGGRSTQAVTSVRMPSFVLPDRANEARFDAARAGFDELGLDLELVGGAVGFTVDSLNEQIVQGLRAADRALTSARV